MMKVRTNPLIVLSSFVGLSLASTHATASSDAQMDACIEAFVAERLPKDRAVTVRKLDATHAFYPSARSKHITLTAKGARSGTQLAAATCIVNDDGYSVSLQEESTSGQLASSVSR